MEKQEPIFTLKGQPRQPGDNEPRITPFEWKFYADGTLDIHIPAGMLAVSSVETFMWRVADGVVEGMDQQLGKLQRWKKLGDDVQKRYHAYLASLVVGDGV